MKYLLIFMLIVYNLLGDVNYKLSDITSGQYLLEKNNAFYQSEENTRYEKKSDSLKIFIENRKRPFVLYNNYYPDYDDETISYEYRKRILNTPWIIIEKKEWESSEFLLLNIYSGLEVKSLERFPSFSPSFLKILVLYEDGLEGNDIGLRIYSFDKTKNILSQDIRINQKKWEVIEAFWTDDSNVFLQVLNIESKKRLTKKRYSYKKLHIL